MSSPSSEEHSDQFLASAHSVSQPGTNYAQNIRVGRHKLIGDEPEVHGGKDAGPAPYHFVLAGLAACTAITLDMYAQRKGWTLGEVKLDLRMFRKMPEGEERIERTISIGGESGESITEEQRARLAEIAEKTPVTKTLKRSLAIPTTVKVGA
jgi:putative redox protein